MRRFTATLLMLALTIAAAAGCGKDSGQPPNGVNVTLEASERDPGGEESSPAVRLPPAGRWFGFSGAAFAWTGRQPKLDQGLTPERTARDALAVGANSARIVAAWYDLEPQPGRLDLSYLADLDRLVAGIERGGGRVLFFLGATPPWASSRPGDPGAPPRADALPAFRRYVSFVAKRWPRALAIETWNEPNGRQAWAPAPDPEAYLRLHRVAARAIRRAAPRTKVILGGMAATPDDSADFMRPQTYLKRMYRAGLKPAEYDGLAVHPYPPQGSPPGSLDGGSFARSFDDFRLGYSWRDPRAAIWVTETGITTTGEAPATENDQAGGEVALTRKLLTMPRVAGVWLHTQYDMPSAAPSAPERGFGVLRSRRAATPLPKPAFCALRRLRPGAPSFPGCG